MSYFLTDSPWHTDDEFDDWDADLDLHAPALTLTAEQRSALVAAVTRGLDERGCDNSLRAARLWATGAGVDWATLQDQLEGSGGYCDCEVLMNVIVVPDDEPEPD